MLFSNLHVRFQNLTVLQGKSVKNFRVWGKNENSFYSEDRGAQIILMEGSKAECEKSYHVCAKSTLTAF